MVSAPDTSSNVETRVSLILLETTQKMDVELLCWIMWVGCELSDERRPWVRAFCEGCDVVKSKM